MISKHSDTMTSREIAQITGKRHDHLMRDIRAMEDAWINLGQPKFGETYYTDQWNRRQPQYELTKIECLYIATKFSDEARGKVILRWEELEIEKLNGGFIIPRSYSEALMLASKQAEELEIKERLLLEQKPKVLFAEAVETSKTSILIGELAKILKQNGVEIGQNRLFDWLRDNGYLISRKGTDYNMPTQKSMELGLFEIKETVINHSDGHISVSKTPKIKGKGQTYFVNKFLNQNRYPERRVI